MNIPYYFVDLLSNFDAHLQYWCATYGLWTLAILALIIFAETGFVFFPFLPGDSMLFIVGVFCGAEILDYRLVVPVMISAAVMGDAVNFFIGQRCGHTLLRRFPRLQGGYDKANQYFAKHGARTIVIARFVPVLRGFAPFVAGFGRMRQKTFTQYNVIGAALWVVVLVGLGMAFGDIPIIQQNLSKAILLIIVISLIPVVIGHRKRTA